MHRLVSTLCVILLRNIIDKPQCQRLTKSSVKAGIRANM
ncbi:Unknown protein sequence [Pseudomonas syringae pv. maculicola]|nr:Unknown protein sequence [Pseudomonas syringae pv. maculicola]